MIVTILIGIILGIPLLLAVIWVLNMLWLAIVNLFRIITGSDRPHGCPFNDTDFIGMSMLGKRRIKD